MGTIISILAKILVAPLVLILTLAGYNVYSQPQPSYDLDIAHLEQTVEMDRERTDAYIKSIHSELNDLYFDIGSAEEAMLDFGATFDIPTPIAFFETSLQSSISSSDTSFTLVSATDKDGNTLASSTYAFVVDEGTSIEEMVVADCTGTACTNAVRGLSVLTGTSTVSSLQKAHRRGASIKITDGPLLLILTRIINGEGTLPNIIKYSSSPSFVDATSLVDKKYVDNLSNQGAATSSETIAGISELATALEVASSTDKGSDDPLVLQAKNATDTPQRGCASGFGSTAGAGCSVIATLLGKISQSWIDLTASFAWTGAHSHSATSTFNSGVDIEADAVAPVSFRDVEYVYPSSQGAATTTWSNDGSGVLSNRVMFSGWERNVATSSACGENANDTCSVTVTCTGTRKVLGGGIFITVADNYSILENYPSDTNSWTVNKKNVAGIAAHTIAAYAICAYTDN